LLDLSVTDRRGKNHAHADPAPCCLDYFREVAAIGAQSAAVTFALFAEAERAAPAAVGLSKYTRLEFSR
jgi:hypothetical protein